MELRDEKVRYVRRGDKWNDREKICSAEDRWDWEYPSRGFDMKPVTEIAVRYLFAIASQSINILWMGLG